MEEELGLGLGLGKKRICVKDRKGREREYNENYKSYCGNAEVIREGLCWKLTPHVLSSHTTGSCMDSTLLNRLICGPHPLED